MTYRDAANKAVTEQSNHMYDVIVAAQEVNPYSKHSKMLYLIVNFLDCCMCCCSRCFVTRQGPTRQSKSV
jgi:muramidase (phage lysozyme)